MNIFLKNLFKDLIEWGTAFNVRWRLPACEKELWKLTFDDGPLPNTMNILNFLASYNIRATFFMVGEQMRRYPKIVAEVVSRGHCIASHGLRHVFMDQLPLNEFARQVEESVAIIKDMTGTRPALFRPPGGLIRPLQVMWLLRHNYRVVFWSHQLNSDNKIFCIQNRKRIGSIILMHDYDDVEVIRSAIKNFFPHMNMQD